VKRILGGLFVFFLPFSSGTFAQEKPDLFSRIERVFHEKEPAWKVERILSGQQSDPVKQSIVFRSRKGQASVELNIWKRIQDAQDVFGGQSLAFDNTAGKKKVKRSLPLVGDENYVWTNPGSAAWPMMMFRKGNIVVSIFAPTLTIVKKFAQYVLNEMAAS
jgi:hypothetical protein